MLSEIKLRPLNTGDAEALAALEAGVFVDAWNASHFGELLVQECFMAVGAMRAEDLLGYVTAYGIEDEVEIVNVAIRADMRGHGLGTRLLRFFLEHVRAMGGRRVFLEVRAGNSVALALYARAGFVHVGVRKRYYADTGEDALILAWPDSHGRNP